MPCKFFKVGGCTAGSSCPFSHSASAEPGQKETCTWFVKGNCKFGHKCALAHVLSPAKAPLWTARIRKLHRRRQRQANAAAEKKPSRPRREVASSSPALPLFSPAARTAPTRGAARPPMGVPLKASISPSAPAPPLKDTDFAAFCDTRRYGGAACEGRRPRTSCSSCYSCCSVAALRATARDVCHCPRRLWPDWLAS